MELEEIEEYSREAEKELVDWNNTLEVPHGGRSTGKQFKLEDVKQCFSKAFAIRELVSLVGSVVIHSEGNDVDLVLAIADLPEDLQLAIKFRLFRGFSAYFNIPYDDVPQYLHLHTKEGGQSPFTSWMPLYKLALVPVDNSERTVRKMSVFDVVDKSFEVLEKSKRRIIAGTVSTDSIDIERQRITPEALAKIWKHYQSLPSEYRNLMDSHSSTQIGRLIPSYRNRKEAFLGDRIYLIAELRNDLPLADKIWEEILKGKLHSFSIKINIPEPLDKKIKQVCSNDGECWTEIRDGRFVEVSLTSSPANPECSDLTILSK